MWVGCCSTAWSPRACATGATSRSCGSWCRSERPMGWRRCWTRSCATPTSSCAGRRTSSWRCCRRRTGRVPNARLSGSATRPTRRSRWAPRTGWGTPPTTCSAGLSRVAEALGQAAHPELGGRLRPAGVVGRTVLEALERHYAQRRDVLERAQLLGLLDQRLAHRGRFADRTQDHVVEVTLATQQVGGGLGADALGA